MGTKSIKIYIKHIKGIHIIQKRVIISAKIQQNHGKIRKNPNFGNTQWKETTLCANKYIHVWNHQI